MTTEHQQLVERSVRRYRSAARRYERRHPEIFNPVEQRRLRESLEAAIPDAARQALDVGAGSGNVTRHLAELGLEVTAADVSPEFLRMLERRFGAEVRTVRLNGVDLDGLADASFDVVTAYSVLHHIPDYLAMLDEMARVLRPGGVVYLDHEVNDEFWRRDGCATRMRQEMERRALERPGLWNPARRRWQRYLIPGKYVLGVRLLFDPDYLFGSEGDIHVWEHDHVEWPRVQARLEQLGLEIVSVEDFLHYSSDYDDDVYERYRESGCTDMRTLVARG
jgi:ubiquinone/menaquinone biosynthesis C-methylase UbiE